jgi:shikimate dehydrogenase
MSAPTPPGERITGTTRVFLVLGDPVSQVQAPQLFNPLFRRHGVDAVLVPAQVAPGRFAAFAREVFSADNFGGLWITIPHKPASAALVDRCSRAAAIAHSVNAVRRGADRLLHGALFDGDGFVKALRHFGFEPAGRSALVFGAGGAGAAIATALVDAGLARLGLHDLGDRAQQLVERLRPHAGSVRIESVGAQPESFDLVVNATPLGLRPDDPPPFEVERVRRDALVVDILMKGAPTALLRACRARGIEAHPGFEMLVQQVPDYLEFFGLHEAARAVQADLSAVRKLLQ